MRYTIDDKKNANAGKWVVRRPDGARCAYTDRHDEASFLVCSLNELAMLRIVLAWQCGQLAESQACALIGPGTKPEDLKKWRDTCLRGLQK